MGTQELIVHRTTKGSKECIGEMLVMYGTEVAFSCKTLELPDKGNAPQVSCIPEGTYKCQKVGPSPSIPYDHFWIKDVPNRSGIKIHRANYFTQLRGCIAVGKAHTDLNKDGEQDVTESKNTLDKLLAMLPDNFDITIK